MENIRERLYLAALLHDIGKFYQRADKKPLENELQALLSLAGWWSAGNDRYIPKDVNDGKSDKTGWENEIYKKTPLYSIFNTINGGNYHSVFPLAVLDIKDSCFPENIEQASNGISQEQYNTHWGNFAEEFDCLPTDSFSGFVESMLYLLKKYTWCIPFNTMNRTNVSLFEHLKTTAAFADCLFLYKEENPNDFIYDSVTNRLQLNDGVCPVLLLGGDLSGIQKFIYNIASRKAALSLKGRSFYLQLLIDSVIQRIISHSNINVIIGNVVYSSGGKFYMLLPNTKKVKNSLAELKNEFEKELWNDHYGQLILNLDYVPFAYDTNSNKIRFENETGKSIGDLWKCLADKLSTGKNHKFKSVLLDNFDSLFDEKSEKFEKIGADVKVCAVTGIESSECVILNDKREDGEDPVYVLPIVKKQTELGNVLKDIDYIITKGKNRSKCNIPIFGSENYLLNQHEISENKVVFRKISSANVTRIKRINEVDFLTVQLNGQGYSYGFQFYGGNKQALEENGEMKTFDDLAKVEVKGKLESTYLGILKMDVDNLGNIFVKGLPEEQRSFAAYSTLSFLLDYFFSGYLNTIRNHADFKDDVNILYSGGDDMFVVGRWDKLIEFAHEIRVRFEKFVGRPDISISGGIAMVGEKFPIAKAAELAGKAEDKAKEFNNKAKNALNLFGENISWQNEYVYVFEWKEMLKSKCKFEKMPRSILHKIMAFAELKRKGDLKYAWHTVYFLKRFSENNKGLTVFCETLKSELLDLNKSRNYALMAIAARWTELELKINK